MNSWKTKILIKLKDQKYKWELYQEVISLLKITIKYKDL